MSNDEWSELLEGSFFEFLHRVVLTDIKPPVFHKMMKEKKKELNDWVLKQLTSDIKCLGTIFKDEFKYYINNDANLSRPRRILKAAHYLASYWEFKIIYQACPIMYGIERTKQSLEDQIEDFIDIVGVNKIHLGKKTFGFIDLCGQLRFQKRWASTPRIPETSVLGHMLFVCYMSYLISILKGACKKRVYNNFFAALFHDLPEVLTRDIISPVKTSVDELKNHLAKYEKEQVENTIFPLIPNSVEKDLEYFLCLNNPDLIWSCRTFEDGTPGPKSADRNVTDINTDDMNAIDGDLIEVCDKLSAFTEVVLSNHHGISSDQLNRARTELFDKYKTSQVWDLDMGKLFSQMNKI
jgi:putative hydrolase of HD superfamily